MNFLSQPKVRLIGRIYGFYLLLIWAAIVFYRIDPYYKGFLSTQAQQILLILALVYSFMAPFFYLLLPLKSLDQSKGMLIPKAFYKLLSQSGRYIMNLAKRPPPKPPKLSSKERTALLFVLVKLFFLPMMISFMLDDFYSVQNGARVAHIATNLMTINSFNSIIFPLLFSLMLLIDVSYFVFGYTVEGKTFRNKVRSVDPTFFGWLVALLSYPPFNNVLGNFAPGYANDYASFQNTYASAILHLATLILFAIYVSASVALGAKASNLTNRGIVDRGPYHFVRHPAYIAKNLVWWLSIIPIFSLAAVASMAVWSTVYFLRAITEERHLIRDPDYQAYCQKVRWRFIPGLV